MCSAFIAPSLQGRKYPLPRPAYDAGAAKEKFPKGEHRPAKVVAPVSSWSRLLALTAMVFSRTSNAQTQEIAVRVSRRDARK